jgi:hypothetical protein
MIIDGEDFYLDLLFYHRHLKRLVAIELKLGKFEAKHKGQMELYLKWLDKYEKTENENPPVGLILCAESSREQVELLEMHKEIYNAKNPHSQSRRNSPARHEISS